MQIKPYGNKNKESGPHSRTSYEDPSRKYVDWVNRLGLEKSFLGRILLFVEEKFQIRIIVGLFLYSFVLAFTMSFEVEPPTEFKIGDLAPVTISSPLTFIWNDEVTTEDKRVQSEEKIMPVFDYDTLVFERISSNIYKAFRVLRAQLRQKTFSNNPLLRETQDKELFQYKPEFEKELGISIPDFLFDWLVQNHFSPRIENMTVRILDHWLSHKLVDAPDRFFSGPFKAITLVDLKKLGVRRESTVNKGDLLDLQSDRILDLHEVVGIDRLNSEERELIFTLARNLVTANVTLNKKETLDRKRVARESVAMVQVTVKKGQPVVMQGQVIQPSHMALFKEIHLRKTEKRQDLIALIVGILFVVIMALFWNYTKRYTLNKIKFSTKDLNVMGLILWGEVVVTKVFLFIMEGSVQLKFGSLIPAGFFMYLAPVAAGPMLVGLLITSGEIVFMFTLFLTLVMGIMLEMNFTYAIVVLTGGLAAARGVFSCKARNDIYWAGVRTGLISATVITLVLILERIETSNFSRDILLIAPASFLSGILSSMVALTFVPLLETVFNYTTDVKLLELSNLNHPLLKEMIVKAPGTYHHSMMVGSMVEAASEEIGANPLLAKVMSYYHDIGKLEHSNYFIENQKPGQNPHDSISPFMSRTLLVAHVKDGVELGMKYKLGAAIIDGILQHHGTTLISFFFNKAVEQKDEDSREIQEEEFRYPGPKPQFREAALVMLADSIEAAARSLDEPNPVRLQNIVKNIIQKKFMDGQLDECNLTLKDLTQVEEAFIRILLGIYHQRIDYPRAAGGGMGEFQQAKPVRVINGGHNHGAKT